MANLFNQAPLQISHVAVILSGAIMTGLAVTCSVPFQYAAPLEWVGVFCLMVGLTCLCSARFSIILAVVAPVFGIVMDPIFIGGQPIQTWLYANMFVFVFGFAGACAGSHLFKK